MTTKALSKKKRCVWAGSDPLYVAYHDTEWGVPVHPPAVAISITIAVVVAHLTLPRARRFHALVALKEQPGLLIMGGVLAAASFLVFLEGLRRSGAGAALSLRNTSIAFTIVLSALLGERVRARQWFGVAMVAAGALFLGH